MRVDFYILADVDDLARTRFACRLAHRAVAAGQRVHIRAEEAVAGELDELLWDYPPGRFLPHARVAAANQEPVRIGAADEAPAEANVLVNLAADIPDYLLGQGSAHPAKATEQRAATPPPRFERVAEVVLARDRRVGRGKYRRYRERGYALFHHELDDWE